MGCVTPAGCDGGDSSLKGPTPLVSNNGLMVFGEEPFLSFFFYISADRPVFLLVGKGGVAEGTMITF